MQCREIPKEDKRKCLYSFRHPLVITLELKVYQPRPTWTLGFLASGSSTNNEEWVSKSTGKTSRKIARDVAQEKKRVLRSHPCWRNTCAKS